MGGLGVAPTGGVQFGVEHPSDADWFVDLKTGIEIGDEAFEAGLFVVAVGFRHVVAPLMLDWFRRHRNLVGQASVVGTLPRRGRT